MLIAMRREKTFEWINKLTLGFNLADEHDDDDNTKPQTLP